MERATGSNRACPERRNSDPLSFNQVVPFYLAVTGPFLLDRSQLRNVLERALIISRGGPIRNEHIRVTEPKLLDQAIPMTFSTDRSLPDVIAKLERSWIEEALQRAGGNKTEAAKLLRMSRFALARHMEKLGISSSSVE